MKYKIKHILSSLIISLLLTFPTAYAAFMLIEVGQVSSINNNSITIDDAQFRISPTVKVITSEKKKGALNDVQKGDFVRISVIKFNRRKLVDTIDILDGPLQEASEP